MKLFLFAFLVCLISPAIYCMDHPKEANYPWLTYLVDVDMFALLVPAPAQQPAPTPPTNAPVNPGMLQALHNELSPPSDKANK